MGKLLICFSIFFLLASAASGRDSFPRDTVMTAGGPLTITFVGHGTLLFEFQGKHTHIDPVSREADYTAMPPADIILITHDHGDHLDKSAIAHIRREHTAVIAAQICAEQGLDCITVHYGDTLTRAGIRIKTVPAYNILHKRSSGEPYHPRGRGNGYVLTFADTRVYVAGDTEKIPEMAALTDIDIAFLPMNLPYTMSPEMAAEAAKTFSPGILYPYHYGRTDTGLLTELLKDEKHIEVRIRDM